MAFKYLKPVANHLFGTDYDPLSDDAANWTSLDANGAYTYATGGAAKNKVNAGAAVASLYQFASYTPGSANYRFHADLWMLAGVASTSRFRLVLHQVNSTNQYEIQVSPETYGYWYVQIIRRVTTGTTIYTSGSIQAGIGEFAKSIDVEITTVDDTSVDFSIRFDDDGSGTATEYAYSDTHAARIKVAGKTGFYNIVITGAADRASIDNIYMYELATGSPAAYFMMANRGEIC